MKKNIALFSALLIAGLAQAQIKNVPIKPVPNQPRIDRPLRIDSTGMTKVMSFKPTMITNLCPWIKTKGDKNFDDANNVSVAVNIWFTYNMRDGDSIVKAKVQFSGAEQGGDQTSVKGEWEKVVYKAPRGWKVRRISSDTNSIATYFTFYANAIEKFSKDGTCMARKYYPGNFGYRPAMPTVQDIRISVHKKEGDDFDEVEASCTCGFRIEKIEFKYLRVTLEHL
jgi:hypothetical protein